MSHETLQAPYWAGLWSQIFLAWLLIMGVYWLFCTNYKTKHFKVQPMPVDILLYVSGLSVNGSCWGISGTFQLMMPWLTPPQRQGQTGVGVGRSEGVVPGHADLCLHRKHNCGSTAEQFPVEHTKPPRPHQCVTPYSCSWGLCTQFACEHWSRSEDWLVQTF